jgi:tRNA(fMet)-specific endonuclease VapC
LTFLLDTNAAIALLNGRPAAVRERLRRAVTDGATIAISTIVLFELWYGAARSQRPRENAERLRVFMTGDLAVLSFGPDDAGRAGLLRATLEAAGTPIGPFDLLIAAHALESGATLVTANVGEFARVPDLLWEDWSVAV